MTVNMMQGEIWYLYFAQLRVLAMEIYNKANICIIYLYI